jgi:hypothetical protein
VNTTLRMAYASTGGWNKGEGRVGGRRWQMVLVEGRVVIIVFLLFVVVFLVRSFSLCLFALWYTGVEF